MIALHPLNVSSPKEKLNVYYMTTITWKLWLDGFVVEESSGYRKLPKVTTPTSWKLYPGSKDSQKVTSTNWPLKIPQVASSPKDASPSPPIPSPNIVRPRFSSTFSQSIVRWTLRMVTRFKALYITGRYRLCHEALWNVKSCFITSTCAMWKNKSRRICRIFAK